MKLDDIWKIPQGVCLQLIDAGQKDQFLVIKREGREFTPLLKGNIRQCELYIKQFNSFFKHDDNTKVTDYFFVLRK